MWVGCLSSAAQMLRLCRLRPLSPSLWLVHPLTSHVKAHIALTCMWGDKGNGSCWEAEQSTHCEGLRGTTRSVCIVWQLFRDSCFIHDRIAVGRERVRVLTVVMSAVSHGRPLLA